MSLLFECDCEHADDVPGGAWIHLAGELDLATAPQLARALPEPLGRARLVALDMRDLEFMDCRGMKAVIAASAAARVAGARLLLLRGTREVDRVFDLTRCRDQVEVVDTNPFLPDSEIMRRLLDSHPG